MVIYFTGTGNSRYVAHQLAEQLQDQALNTGSYIQKSQGYVFHNEKPLVFVAPVYVSAPPVAFLEFLKRSEFSGSREAYFVMTCAGGMGGSPEYCRRVCGELGLTYMGCASVLMPQNYIAFFTMKTPEENSAIVRAASAAVQPLADAIAARQSFPDPGMKKWEYISTQMILKLYYKGFISAKKFRVEEGCIGCGKCASVCPLGNIQLTDKVPVWGNRCTHCMACINQCPKDVIQYGSKTAGKIRYRGPEQVLKITQK